VKECIDTGWVSSAGKFVDRFEEELCRYTGAAPLWLWSMGRRLFIWRSKQRVLEAGDEVLVPDLTFVATANAVSYTGAILILWTARKKL